MRGVECISIGDRFQREMTITDHVMSAFLDISGDDNPLHINREYALHKGHSERVAYGNLIGLMVSSLVGVEMARFEAMLVSQTILYRKPVYVADTIFMNATIINKLESMDVAELKIEVRKNDNSLVATGKVQVKFI